MRRITAFGVIAVFEGKIKDWAGDVHRITYILRNQVCGGWEARSVYIEGVYVLMWIYRGIRRLGRVHGTGMHDGRRGIDTCWIWERYYRTTHWRRRGKRKYKKQSLILAYYNLLLQENI